MVLADKLGLRSELQPEYWQRFEDTFALEANEFIGCIVEDKPVPLPMERGLEVMQIGWALQEALLSGSVQRFKENGQRLPALSL